MGRTSNWYWRYKRESGTRDRDDAPPLPKMAVSTQDLRAVIVTKNQLPNVLRTFDEIPLIRFQNQTFARERLALIFWCEGLEWSTAGQARHLPPVVIPLLLLLLLNQDLFLFMWHKINAATRPTHEFFQRRRRRGRWYRRRTTT